MLVAVGPNGAERGTAGHRCPLGELGPGDFCGELSLLIDAPRNATVTALTPMETIVLSRKEFDAALADAPRMTRKIMSGMASRLAEYDSRV